MDFHIDKKTAYLMLGALVIGMVTGAWLSNMSMHRHMSRMMRGGDMDMMMQGNMRDKKDMMKNDQSMDQRMPTGQASPDQQIPEPQMVPVNN